MNARALVNRLLEADQGPANEQTGVYIFGPNLPDSGYPVSDMVKAIQDFERFGFLSKGAAQQYKPEEVINYLVSRGYTFFIKKAPNDIEAIGRVPAKTTPDGQERASQFLGLERKDQIQHRANMTATPKALNVDYALYGSKELEREQREKRTVQTQQLGKIDPHEEKWKEPPTGVGYKEQEFMPLDAPVQVGFVYDDTEEGLRVMEVIPGGPAAQAGLQAGDFVVQVREFKPRDKDELIGPYYVYTGRDLEWVLRKADPEHLIPFRVYRGDRPMNVPIQPQPKQAEKPAGQEMHIPGEQVRDYFRKQRPKGKRQGPYQRTFTRRLFPPNERTPAAETGNQPANVSSLT